MGAIAVNLGNSARDVALLGRFYERFADHAVEIGRRVIFQATGKIPDDV